MPKVIAARGWRVGGKKREDLFLAAMVPFLMVGVLFAAASPPALLLAAEDDERPVAAAHDDAIEVIGPTLIAFFPQVSAQQVEANPGLVDMLDDFYDHLNAIGTTLVGAGVRIYARPVGEIRIVDRGGVRTLAPPPKGSDIGYYMVAPGLEARLVLGIYTDLDLIEEVDRYDATTPQIAYTVEDDMLHVFGHALKPRYKIELADSPEDDDTSSISFPRSGDGRWVVIVHSRDVNSIEFWLYDSRTEDRPVRIPIGSGRHGNVTWHGDDIIEITFTGMGHTVSEFVHVARPDEPFQVANLLHYDDVERVYVSFLHDGVEIGRLFEDEDSPRERIPIDLEYESVVDARMTIEKVNIEGGVVTVTHRRKDGTVARQSFSPRILQR